MLIVGGGEVGEAGREGWVVAGWEWWGEVGWEGWGEAGRVGRSGV